jgi:hypothetical protein
MDDKDVGCMYHLMIFRKPFNIHLFICISILLSPQNWWVNRAILQVQITTPHMAVGHVNVHTRGYLPAYQAIEVPSLNNWAHSFT